MIKKTVVKSRHVPPPYTGERAIPWNSQTGAGVMSAHMARYALAMAWVEGHHVVDLGSGMGYGSFVLSMVARSVMGVDKSHGACVYASGTFQRPNLSFLVCDIMQRIPSGGIYTCFEVLEHLADPWRLFEKLGKRPFVWSVPINDDSRYHLQVFRGLGDVLEFFPEEWTHETLYFQKGACIIEAIGAPYSDPEYIIGVTNV